MAAGAGRGAGVTGGLRAAAPPALPTRVRPAGGGGGARSPTAGHFQEAAGHQGQELAGSRTCPVVAAVDGRLIVMAPLGYRRHAGGKRLYRQPASLGVPDPGWSLAGAVQGYAWRWEQDINFRDEKTLRGVIPAQVPHPESGARRPAWPGTAARALPGCAPKLCESRHCGIIGLPRVQWRGQEPPRQTSTAKLINQLREDARAGARRPETCRGFGDAPAPAPKPEKLGPSLPAAIFFAQG